MGVTRADIVACARSWLDVPWKHQGRARDGVDCGGLILVVGWELGLLGPLADPKTYDRNPNRDFMLTVCKRGGLFPVREALPGDVVVVKPAESLRWPSHMGILSRLADGELGFIHSYGTPGSKQVKRCDGVVETHFAGWQERLLGRFRYPGVED